MPYDLYSVWIGEGPHYASSKIALYVALNAEDARRQAKEEYPSRNLRGEGGTKVKFAGFKIIVEKL